MKFAKQHPSCLAALAFCCLFQALAASGKPASAEQTLATEPSGGIDWTYSIGENGAIVTAASPAEGTLTVPSTLGDQPVVEIGYAAFSSCEDLTSVVIPSGVQNIADRAFQYCSLLEEVTIPASVTNIGTLAFQYCESLAVLALPQNLEGIGTNACYRCDGLQKLYVPVAWWGTSKAASVGVACPVVYGEPDRESVVFDANGGSCASTVLAYALGEAYGWLPEATHTSCAFTGWWTVPDGGLLVTATNLASVEGRRVLYAQWTPTIQVVTFDPNGGVCSTTNRNYAFDSTYSPLPRPTREHYAFEGWWTSSSGGVNITEESPVSTNTTRTLYAHWTLSEQVVTFEPNGGVCDTATQVFNIGSAYSPLPQPTKEHYAFEGWWTSSSGGVKITEESTVSANPTRTLYARWTPTEQVVTFNPNGGVCETPSRSYGFDSTYSPLPQPTREHYAFEGWWTSSTGGMNITEESTVSANPTLTLYAHWILSEQVVTFDPNGGVCDTASKAFEIGKTYKPLPKATREGYAFDGWFTAASGGDRLSAASIVTTEATRTLYAYWTLVEQRVAFDANGGTCPTASHAYAVGGTYAWFPEAVREGCVFIGWQNPEGKEVVGTSVVSAQRFLTLQARWLQCSLINDEACVTGMIPTNAAGTIAIPAEFQGYPVTRIETNAFSGCSGLTSVAIPDSVTTIGNSAFRNCSGLTAVHIQNLAAWCGISFGNSWANPLYYAQHLYLEGEEVTDLVIPNGVTNIGNYAFSGCRGLASVAIADSVTSIGNSAFSGCSGLTAVHIQNLAAWCGISFGNSWANPLYYAQHLYLEGEEVTDLAIPNGVTNIGNYAFSGCRGLASVAIADSVTSIGNSAFSGCSGLTAVHIQNLAAWCGISFDNSSANPLYYVHHLYLEGEEVMDLVIPNGVTNIGNYAFSGCRGLTSVAIPDSVTSIGEGAFNGCSGLTSVAIPDGVTSIGNSTFNGCSGLTSVTLPDSVTSIGNSAFRNCSGLTSVTIPDSVTGMGNYAFSDCSGLTSVTLLGNVTNDWESNYRPFGNCTNLSTLVLGEKMTKIGDFMFSDCSGLTDVAIPESVTSIGNSAFRNCSGLTCVTIPDSATGMGDYAFSDCSGLTSVTLLGNVTNDWASNCRPFGNCTNLSTLVLGEKMTKIGAYAFRNCSGLTSVTIPDSVTSIMPSAFSGCSNLTSVTLGNSVEYIYHSAFYRCSGLTSMTIPDSVTSIGQRAFAGCSSLETLYAPEFWREKYVDGSFWSSYASVPSSCTIIYYATRTSTGVPYEWLEEHGFGNGTAEGWEMAATADAANGVNKVWECYVAGLDPTNAASRFTTSISFASGSPEVTWTPDLNENNTKSVRSYEVEGKTALTDDWGPTNAATRFFRVKVDLPAN